MNTKELQKWEEHYKAMARMFAPQHFDYVVGLIENLRNATPWKADMFCKALFDLHHKGSVAI